MNKLAILPLALYEGHYDNNKSLDEFVKSKKTPITPSFLETLKYHEYPISTNFEVSDLPESFQKFLNDSIEEVLFFEKIKYEKFKIVSIWINFHEKPYNKHKFHRHPNSIFSGVYYYETLDADSIVFLKQNTEFTQYFAFETSDNNPYGELRHRKMVSVGDLLMFRSDLIHGVENFKKENNSTRTSISFNVDLHGVGSKSKKTYR